MINVLQSAKKGFTILGLLWENMNLIIIKTLYIKEIRRFMKVCNQTVISPVVNALLFYNIFTLAFHKAQLPGAVSYNLIISTGLIMMSMLQNAYANTSSSISMAKVLGFITDYIVPPVSKLELLIAFCLGAITRGVLVGICVYLAFLPFVSIPLASPILLVVYVILSLLCFSLLGVIFGSISNNFDKAHAFQSYIVTPLTFLSGTFYSPANLPIFWQNIIKINPVYYMIDGFRFAITGRTDGNIAFGLCVISLTVAVLSIVTLFVMNKFYRID
jgi:ABC-2 type transport system permease protein